MQSSIQEIYSRMWIFGISHSRFYWSFQPFIDSSLDKSCLNHNFWLMPSQEVNFKTHVCQNFEVYLCRILIKEQWPINFSGFEILNAARNVVAMRERYTMSINTRMSSKNSSRSDGIAFSSLWRRIRGSWLLSPPRRDRTGSQTHSKNSLCD